MNKIGYRIEEQEVNHGGLLVKDWDFKPGYFVYSEKDGETKYRGFAYTYGNALNILEDIVLSDSHYERIIEHEK